MYASEQARLLVAEAWAEAQETDATPELEDAETARPVIISLRILSGEE